MTVLDLYEPYIAAGVATRVHLNTRPALSTGFCDPIEICFLQKSLYPCDGNHLRISISWQTAIRSQGYATHNWMVNDCLYRARGHTRWLMPTVDVDEYVRFRPSLMTGDYMRTVWDKLADSHKGKDGKPDHRQVSCVMLDRVIFERAVPDPDLEISNVYRYPRSSLCPKYVDPWASFEPYFLAGLEMLQAVILSGSKYQNGSNLGFPCKELPSYGSGLAYTMLQARASLINVLFIHWPTSWVNGSVWQKVAARPRNRNLFLLQVQGW